MTDATLNEDWLRTRTWDVTKSDGSLVTDLDTLAAILGLSREQAAKDLLTLPYGQAAPADLVAEAKAAQGDGPATPPTVAR